MIPYPTKYKSRKSRNQGDRRRCRKRVHMWFICRNMYTLTCALTLVNEEETAVQDKSAFMTPMCPYINDTKNKHTGRQPE